MAAEVAQSLSLSQRHPHQSGSLQVTAARQPPSEPGHGAIAVLSCALGEGSIENGSTRYAVGATIAARVLSTNALISVCSAAGTENLSRVVCTSSMNASHSPGVIAISRWDSSILRPE